jgi:hypothetical protein
MASNMQRIDDSCFIKPFPNAASSAGFKNAVIESD